MKNLFFIIVMMALNALETLAQPYAPLTKPDIVRDEFWGNGEAGLCYYVYGTHFWFGGDTVIQGKLYRRLKNAGISGNPEAPEFCPPYTTDTAGCQTLFLLHEDTLTRRVYQLDSNGIDQLWYDFSLLPGDSIYDAEQQDYIYLDTITLEFNFEVGNERRVFYFDNGIRWMEGVGNPNNFLNPFSPLCICWHLLCTYHQQEFGCAEVVGVSDASVNDIRVYPNPFSEVIQMEHGFIGGRATLFDLYGRPVWSQEMSGEQLKIGTAQVASGTYMLQLDNGQRRFYKKLIKQ